MRNPPSVNHTHITPLTATFAALLCLATAGIGYGQSNVTVVNPSTNPVQTKVTNTASSPVPTTVNNTATAPVNTKVVSGTVTVGNTAGAPVNARVVSGSVTINNTSAAPVNAKIVNPATAPVPVAGTVKIGNLATAPVLVSNVNEPLRQPFQRALVFQITDGNEAFFTSFTVPANKRLVIEQLSASAAVPQGVKIRGHISVNSNKPSGLGVPFLMKDSVPFSTSEPQIDYLVLILPIKLYADPGTTVHISALRGTRTGPTDTHVEVVGYLESVVAPTAPTSAPASPTADDAPAAPAISQEGTETKP